MKRLPFSPRRRLRSLVAITASLVASLFCVTARANQSGLAGYSGKPNVSAPAGESCNQCHSGGTAPQITIAGPSTLAAGQTGDYALVVQTAQSRAAGAVAATDGIVLTPVAGVRDSFGEMVPNGGVTVAGGQATFRFRVTAPLTGSTLRLWGVGLAANGNNAPSGDRAAHMTRDITVTGGLAPTPDAGGSSGGDASTAPSSDGGDAGSTGPGTGPGSPSRSSGPTGTSATASGGDDGTENPAPTGSGKNESEADAGSCSSSPASRIHRTGGARGTLLACGGMIALMASARRRRGRE